MECHVVKKDAPQSGDLSHLSFGRSRAGTILKWAAVVTASVLSGCKEKESSSPPSAIKTEEAVVSHEPEQKKNPTAEPSLDATFPPIDVESLVPKVESPVMPMPLTDKCADVQLLPEHLRFNYKTLTEAAMILCQLDPQVAEILKDQRGVVVSYVMPSQISDYVGKLTTPELGKQAAGSLEEGKDASLVTLYSPHSGVVGHYIFIDIISNKDFPEIITVLNHEIWHIKNQVISSDIKTSQFGSSNKEEIQVIDDSIASLTRIIERLRGSEPVMDEKSDRELADIIEGLLVKERNVRARLAAEK